MFWLITVLFLPIKAATGVLKAEVLLGAAKVNCCEAIAEKKKELVFILIGAVLEKVKLLGSSGNEGAVLDVDKLYSNS